MVKEKKMTPARTEGSNWRSAKASLKCFLLALLRGRLREGKWLLRFTGSSCWMLS